MRWLVSRSYDTCWFLLPNFLGVLLALALNPFLPQSPLPYWFWISFVLIIDVGHVYSTLFRTYFFPQERRRYSGIIWLIPFLVWTVGAVLFTVSSSLFWTVLAYIAVFHFVRQQYGFLAIYQNEASQLWRKFEKYLIYLSMLHPLIYWHSHKETVFRWFVPEDFIFYPLNSLSFFCGWLLLCGLGLMLLRLCFLWFRRDSLSMLWPRYLLIFGTALAWHVGIVAFNSDLIFTVTNIFSHGVPYYGIILAFSLRQQPSSKTKQSLCIFGLRFFFMMILACVTFAYIEEGFWHGLYWRSYLDSYFGFQNLPQLQNPILLSVVIPLLAVPQATHYILDGFIWKLHGPKPFLSSATIQEDLAPKI